MSRLLLTIALLLLVSCSPFDEGEDIERTVVNIKGGAWCPKTVDYLDWKAYGSADTLAHALSTGSTSCNCTDGCSFEVKHEAGTSLFFSLDFYGGHILLADYRGVKLEAGATTLKALSIDSANADSLDKFRRVIFGCTSSDPAYCSQGSLVLDLPDTLPVQVESVEWKISQPLDGLLLGEGTLEVLANSTEAKILFNYFPINGNVTVEIKYFSNGVLLMNSQGQSYPPQSISEAPLNFDSFLNRDSLARAYRLGAQCQTGSAGCLSDPRQGGRNYRTVTIGGKTWMAENLDYEIIDYYPLDVFSFCYDQDPLECAVRGRLYTYAGMLDGLPVTETTRGICPGGWHIPSDAEWTAMEVAAGMDAALASSTETDVTGNYRGSHANALRLVSSFWDGQSADDNNASGFSAIPGGYRIGTLSDIQSPVSEVWTRAVGIYGERADGANFWTVTPDPTDQYRAFKRKLASVDAGVWRGPHWKYNAYSLRCVKN
jgi:uncharacterized protein (TIGR02145 family)